MADPTPEELASFKKWKIIILVIIIIIATVGYLITGN